MSRKPYWPRRRTAQQQSQPAILAAVALTFVTFLLVAVLFSRGSAPAAGSATAAGGPLAKSSSSNSRPSVTLPSNINQKKVPCGTPCSTVNPGWVSVPAASPQEMATSEFASTIASTISHTEIFAGIESRYGQLQINTPALVYPYGPVGAGASDYFLDAHWVASVYNAQGQECGIFDFVYDSAHNRMRFSSYGVVTPRDPQYGKAFPFISSSSAEAQVQRVRHVALLSNAAPELIFFPAAFTWQTTGAPKNWAAGGTSPMDPIWLIPGADGQNYFVGTTMQVYSQQELPITAG